MRAVTFRAAEFQKVAQGWWAQYYQKPIVPDLLSRYGVAVMDGTEVLALGHLYPASTAPIMWLGFTIRAPHLTKYKAGKALKLLLPACEEAARQLGYTILYTSFDAPALQKLCKQRGFYSAQTPVVEQWKAVCDGTE